MNHSKASLLLHPQRLRIMQCFLGNRQLTVQQIAERMPDIPQATLYRQLNQLVKGGLIFVVQQNQKRGTIEKVYAAAEQAGSVSEQDLENVDRDELLRHFILFVTMLIDDFESYLSRKEPLQLLQDGVGFRQASLYLTDEEFQQFAAKLSAVFQEVLMNEPAPGRRRRMVSTIFMPGLQERSNQPTQDGGEQNEQIPRTRS